MNNQARIVRKNNRLATWLAGLAGAAALVGCSGDGSVGVGSGQDPDPVAIDFPVAYVKAPVPVVDPNVQQQPTDIRDVRTFEIGADLFVRDRASPSAVEINVTESITQGLGDVRDVEISEDGNRVLFAMRAQFIPNADEEDQPTWNIWEYDIAGDALRRVIASDIFAEDGHDVSPQYLPDGRIVFSSTRQRQSKATLLDEGKPQYEAQDEDRNEPAFVLHVMESDGSNIHQISFNQSHDFDPAVLSNGKVLFSRWDNAGPLSGIHLYQVNPDGSDLELLYGANSHFTGTNGAEVHFLQPHEMPDGQVMAIMRPFAGTDFGGDIVIVDVPTFIENNQPTASNPGMPGPAQAAATINVVTTDLAPSPGGRFASAFPLWDGTDRILVAWSQCRLEENMVIVPCTETRLADPNAVAAPPLYGIWMYDMTGDTQVPVVAPEEGIMVTEVVAAQPRPTPNVIPDRTPGVELDLDLAAENVGLLNIRSVYDIDGVAVANIDALADPGITTSASLRPARFLRIEKAVALPDQDTLDFVNTAFGRSAQQGMREILAYAMIEPDGSVMTKVPANVPFAVSVLDENGRRITPRHQNWLQVLPGDTLSCNGCHDPASGLSHGRQESFDPAYAGATTTAQPFPNTVSAIFADMGETMAEARMRISCGASLSTCAEITPSVDIRFDDVWTDPAPAAANRAADASFAYRYADVMQPPTSAACMNTWEPNCRIVVNYEDHVHPMWTQVRQILDPVDPNIVLVDNTCTRCHGTVDAANNLQAPVASLNLEDGLSNQVTDHFESYRQLMFQRTALMLDAVNMVLVPQTIVVGTDPVTGLPITQNVVLNPPMNVAGANFSNNFLLRFDTNGTHTFVDPTDGLTKSYLTGGELKMIAEWLDIGGQYFNNPFDAPVN